MHDPLFKKKGSRKFWCRIPNPKGGRHLRESTGQYERGPALAVWRRRCREVLSASEEVSKPAPTLTEALARRFQERKQAGRAAGTLDMYEDKGEALESFFGTDTPIDQIDAAAIDDYIAHRLKKGRKHSTIHKELTVLRGALRLARRRKEYPFALDEVMPLDFSPKYKPRTRALAVWEVDKLLGKLPTKYAAVVAFIVATGATYPSEAINFDAQRDIQGSLIHLRGTKRETRDRWVPLPSWARRWFSIAKKTAPLPKWSNVRRDLINACEEAGIERCSPNDLRRTFGHQLRARGVAPHLIAAMMGHVDSRMAERVYAKLQPAELAHLIRRGPARGQKRAA